MALSKEAAAAEKKMREAKTWANYGIKVLPEDWDGRKICTVECNRCGHFSLELNDETKSWHCGSCSWGGSVQGSAMGLGALGLERAAPMLERWHADGAPPAVGVGLAKDPKDKDAERRLDDLYKPRRGEMTVVTGAPGDGKSTWLLWYAVQLMVRYGWRFLIFSPENTPHELLLGQLAAKFIGKPFFGPFAMRSNQLKLAKGILGAHFTIIDPMQPTAEAIMGEVTKTVNERQHGTFQGLIIDPWTEVEHDIPAGMREDQYLNKKLGQLRRLSRGLHLHTWLVVHPRSMQKEMDGRGKKKLPVPTLDDLSGGVMFKNKTDWGLAVHRPHKGVEDKDSQVDIHIQKARFAGFLGGGLGATVMSYDPDGLAYFDNYLNEVGQIGQMVPFDIWKKDRGEVWQKYFDDPNYVWPPHDPLMLRPIAWRIQPERKGWWHDEGKLVAYIDENPTSGDAGAKLTYTCRVQAKADRDRNRDCKADDKEQAFSWCERLLMEWDLMPDPRPREEGAA